MNGATGSGWRKTALLATVGLLIAIGLPELDLGRRLAPGGDLASMLLREGVWWVLLAVLVAYILLAERRSLSSIGLRRPDWKTVVFAIPVAVLLVAVIVLSYTVVFPAIGLRPNASAMSKIMATPLWFRFLLVTRAAVCEEVFYRAYPIERIGGVTGSRTAAVVFSVAAFSVAHLSYWGWAQLIPVAVGGLLLALFYVWRRDLLSNMIAHFLADGSGFLFH